jgi:23S rRNA (uridine2552-2'-O)-methyltransferase
MFLSASAALLVYERSFADAEFSQVGGEVRMTGRDEYYNKAKQEGYRARSAYKLKQLDEQADLLNPEDVVVDLGAAPGGWLQVAREVVGDRGTVIGVDRQRIDPIDGVETIRGDITDQETVTAISERFGEIDVVLSDLAPDMTGEYEVDHARSVHLARQAFAVAEKVLTSGGDFAVKVFQGRDLADFEADLQTAFTSVRTIVPDASRDASSEVYLVGKGYLTAPVSVGDELTVTIEDEGSEGDGVALVEGFTVFVPESEAGEEVSIEVTDVKPRFAFAERR